MENNEKLRVNIRQAVNDSELTHSCDSQYVDEFIDDLVERLLEVIDKNGK
jgi:hypothetical protein